jgi:hypothetical protein
VQAWRCSGEAGYDYRLHGYEDRQRIEREGLAFVAVRDAAWKKAAERFGLLAEDQEHSAPTDP